MKWWQYWLMRIKCAVGRHEPVYDMCLLDEHVYCINCEKPMPNALLEKK